MGAANSRSRHFGETQQSDRRKTGKKVNFGPDGAGGSAQSESSQSGGRLKSVAVHPAGDRRMSNGDSLYKEYQSTFGDVSAMDHFG